MALTTAQIQAAYVTFFNRPADVEGLNYWSSYNGSVGDLYATFAASSEYSDVFSGLSASAQVNTVYQNLFGRQAEAAGLNYWVGELVAGKITLANLALAVTAGAQSTDLATYENRVIASTAFTNELDTTAEILAYQGNAANAVAKEWLSKVTDTPASLASATSKAVIDSSVGAMGTASTGQSITLTVGQDNLQGTTGNDTFKSNVVQNAMGTQVNTLGSGDELSGGAGTDTLNAKITAGAFVNGSATMPIQPETSSIELVKLQAVQNDAVDHVYVNAKDMVDVRYIGSEGSDADLTILNMTTRRGSELKAEGDLNGKLAETVVGMKYTNTATKTVNDESDFTVKFDQDYLVGSSSAVDGYYYDLLDQAAYDADNLTPLKGFPLTGVNFSLSTGGAATNYSLTLPKAEMDAISTHAQLVQALNQKLAETYPALQNLQFKLQGQFSDTEGLRTSDRIVLVDTDSGDRTVSGGNIVLDTAQGAGNLYWNQGPVDTVTTAIPVSIKVELEKVGLAGDGGDLLIGSMNDGGTNTFKDALINTTTKTVSGIEEFNVTVVGDKSKSSSLASLHSTNNNLRTVNVTSAQQTDAANLTIGNTNTSYAAGNQGALKDVKTFDASAFKGDLTLHAALTDEVVAKYLDLKDKSPAEAAADNAAFLYTGGTGNDTIDLQVSSSNLAKQGTATREDMSVSIAGGAGNDKITLTVVDNGTATQAASGTWYINQKQMANLSINAGEGDDTIWTPGSGDVKIDAGAGNDTVYSDNTGTKAAWVFNAAGTVTSDLVAVAPVAATATQFLYKGVANVTFKGYEVKADIPTGTNYAVTQLQINQAIKKAINDDPVLSKLLLAEDGPASTLVVTSLIDGTAVVGDLGFTVTAATLTAAELPAANTAFAKFQALYPAASSAAAADANAANAVTVADKTAVAKALATDLIGAVGTGDSDNTINGGAGNDVLVLSTSASAEETLVYSGYDLGKDSIVNFTTGAAAAGVDKLDFSAYLTSKATATAALPMAITVNADNTLEANSITELTATFTTTDTFAGLTAAKLLATLNTGGTAYAGLTNAINGDVAGFAGEGKAVVLIENNLNAGEYAAFELTFTDASAGEFTGVKAIGVLDFGAAQTFDNYNLGA